MFMYKGEATFGKIRKMWKCVIFEYERIIYGLRQVFGHVAASRGFKSIEKWQMGYAGR